jgi:hypothetical protein
MSQVCGANTTRGVSRQWRPGKNCNCQVLFPDFVSCPICMASLLHRKIVLAFLSKLRFARDYAKRCLLGRFKLSLLLAFLGKWWHSRPGKPGTSQTLKPADPSFLGTKAISYSVSGRPTIVKQCTVAASSVPASASLPSLHERVERQPATMVGATRVGTPPAPGRSGRDPVNRRSASMGSTQSRASDRFSMGPHDEPVLGSPTSSSAATSDYTLPHGRFVQLINSDQVPRYNREAMQVEYTILSSYPYTSLQTSHGDTL